MMEDTDLATRRLYYGILRKKTPEERVELGLKLSARTKAIAFSGIRSQYPQATEAEVRREYLKRILPRRQFEALVRGNVL